MKGPMFEQYRRIKSEFRDALLLFRLGDFYELFGDDAREGARLLGLTLTQRQGVPMCGVPHHAARGYVGRLIAAGRKVALCEQVEAPTGRGLTRREVVEVLTPGTLVDSDYLDPSRDNTILAAVPAAGEVLVAWAELSTGRLGIGARHRSDEGPADDLIRSEVARFGAREVIIPESWADHSSLPHELADAGVTVNRVGDWEFDSADGARAARALFGVASLAGFGIDDGDRGLAALAPLVAYLERNQRRAMHHITTLTRDVDGATVQLDAATIRNLEIVEGQESRGREFSLLSVADRTVTAMGARLLRRRLLQPDVDLTAIERRLDAVDALYRGGPTRHAVRDELATVHDVARIAGRVGSGRATPRDLWSISRAVASATVLSDLCDEAAGALQELRPAPSQRLDTVAELISRALIDEPPPSTADGGYIVDGYDGHLDELRRLERERSSILEAYVAGERERTGVASLKVRFNRILGSFFEVPTAQASRLDETFIRRQSLASVERFTTTELDELQQRIERSVAEALERERELFDVLTQQAIEALPDIVALADQLARLDVAQSGATVAIERGWTRPHLYADRRLEIEAGRHPVVEAHLPPGTFVPNDLTIGGDGARFALITGPNMAGKSTVLRQVALITLLAQTGSFVPASAAHVGLVDRIFCRVGASDNIARGASTFLVEMTETSSILRNATDASLVIMDEVGRGTSTHDGLAIAWAVSAFLRDETRARTLFATHYHELGALAGPLVQALQLRVDHDEDRIVFLRRLEPGAADRSYGIDVARLAGIPDRVVHHARTILLRLESGQPIDGLSESTGDANAEPTSDAPQSEVGRASGNLLFSAEEMVASEIRSTDPDALTPREALEAIYRWHAELTEDGR